MGRLEDPPRYAGSHRPVRIFHGAAGLLSHAPIPGGMPSVQRFTRFSSQSFSGKIDRGNQNNAGPDMSGTAREKPECFDVIV